MTGAPTVDIAVDGSWCLRRLVVHHSLGFVRIQLEPTPLRPVRDVDAVGDLYKVAVLSRLQKRISDTVDLFRIISSTDTATHFKTIIHNFLRHLVSIKLLDRTVCYEI